MYKEAGAPTSQHGWWFGECKNSMTVFYFAAGVQDTPPADGWMYCSTDGTFQPSKLMVIGSRCHDKYVKTELGDNGEADKANGDVENFDVEKFGDDGEADKANGDEADKANVDVAFDVEKFDELYPIIEPDEPWTVETKAEQHDEQQTPPRHGKAGKAGNDEWNAGKAPWAWHDRPGHNPQLKADCSHGGKYIPGGYQGKGGEKWEYGGGRANARKRGGEHVHHNNQSYHKGNKGWGKGKGHGYWNHGSRWSDHWQRNEWSSNTSSNWRDSGAATSSHVEVMTDSMKAMARMADELAKVHRERN